MRILFQGDSVTDCNRKYDDPNDLGQGYVVYTVEAIKNSFPNVYFEFINRGISGNRTENLLDRVEKDLIDLNPDIVTILIGVNDTWHRYMIDLETTIESFRSNYETVLRRIKNETKAKIIMLEPFILYNMGKDNMRADLNEKIDVIRQLAMEYADAFIPLDGIFVAANASGVNNVDLSPDGVHPDTAGKKLIANELAPVVCKFIEEIM
ncbi:MAG: SGNH/GDSL hydrolase family protein [Clostridia bacterium]|nr:SGNH/GDSL hydrolase family protein [Clostridia bacterium]